jgi:hypothetical protein
MLPVACLAYNRISGSGRAHAFSIAVSTEVKIESSEKRKIWLIFWGAKTGGRGFSAPRLPTYPRWGPEINPNISTTFQPLAIVVPTLANGPGFCFQLRLPTYAQRGGGAHTQTDRLNARRTDKDLDAAFFGGSVSD